MKNYLILFGIFILIGCAPEKEFHTYELENGDIVQCKVENWWGELRSLDECKDGSKYINPRNVKKLD